MWIFGPLPCSTISPVTVTLARAAASLVTVTPSTRRMAGRATVSPAAPARRLIVNVSPTATLCWLPPAFTTAYTTDSSLLSCLALCSGAQTGAIAGCWTGCARLARRHPEAPARWRCNPTSVPERRAAGRHGLVRRSSRPTPPGVPEHAMGPGGGPPSGDGRTRRPAGRPAAARPRRRGVLLDGEHLDRSRFGHGLGHGLVGGLVGCLVGDGDHLDRVRCRRGSLRNRVLRCFGRRGLGPAVDGVGGLLGRDCGVGLDLGRGEHGGVLSGPLLP